MGQFTPHDSKMSGQVMKGYVHQRAAERMLFLKN